MRFFGKRRKPKTIVLTEVSAAGHFSTYMLEFAKAFLKLGYDVVVFFPRPEMISEKLEEALPELASKARYFSSARLETVDVPYLRKDLRVPSVRFDALYQLLSSTLDKHELKNSLLFLCWYSPYKSWTKPRRLDPWIFWQQKKLIERSCPIDWMAMTWHYDDDPVRQRGVMASRYCKALGIFHDTDVAAVEKAYRKPVFGIPDFSEKLTQIPETELSKMILRRASGRKIIGLAGALHHRKGILRFFDLLEQLDPDHYCFALLGLMHWGQLTDEDKTRIKDLMQRENCVTHLEFLESEDELCAAMRTFDIIFASYPNHPGSSGMLFKSAFLKRPLLVSTGGAMQQLTEQHRLGMAVDYHNLDAFAPAVQELLERDPASFGYEGYLTVSDPANLVKKIGRVMDETYPD